ncbi:MAG TPA: hypothetical protein ENO03_02555 [Candidatus Aminicenantes bacterium]|nr:hypothetical protein [Candidatus Aminicenantes bacterium]
MKRTGTFLTFGAALGCLCFVFSGCGKEPAGTAAGAGAEAGPAAAGPLFGYPAAGEPWYHVRCALELESVPGGPAGADWTVDRVLVDGARVRDFLVFQDGREVDKHAVKAARGKIALEVKARHVWRPGAPVEMKVDLVEPESGDIQVLAASGTAPSGKGYWDPAWKNYLSLVLSEEHGYERRSYPVHATVGVLADYLGSPDEVRVVRAEKAGPDVLYREVPSQVYDVVTWRDPDLLTAEESDAVTGEKVVRYHPTTTFSVAFLADVGAREKATYLVFYNNPGALKPAYATDLTVTKGQGLGRTVENDFYRIVLHETSGVVHEIVEKTTGITLEHKLETNGAIHWNPDLYAPPHAWYHSSDWTDPEARETAGPVFYAVNLEGRLPQPEAVDIGLRYRFYAGSPVVMVESIMTVGRDVFVKAVRNAEVVFNHEVFTKAAFKRDGRTEVLDFAASRMHPDHAAVLRPDTPWVTFFDEGRGVGFATLFLDQATPNLRGGQASLQQPYIYIQHGLWFYVSRGFVYSFGSNNQTRMLPVAAGSVYYDRSAWIAYPVPKREGLGDYLDGRSNALKWPLDVREDIETYAESPEGWLVPILTEPFEEGVRDARGGKERRK